mmetsp:Transcript_27978/g.87150  ORF Transcript_27978/g.87150 Transcript_27978/m.87150 type:complete len:180 (+) Transcript_27978:514-1053(+)
MRGKKLLTQVAMGIYGATEFFGNRGDSKHHLSLECPLARGTESPCGELPPGSHPCTTCLNLGIRLIAGAVQGVGTSSSSSSSQQPLTRTAARQHPALESRGSSPAFAPATPPRRTSGASEDLTPPAIHAPPVAPNTWFRTPTGKKFHIQEDCLGLRKAMKVMRMRMMPRDLEPCKLCCS